ncbi:MAG: GNAT family N-acyltransferase [Pseudomonadota bacterium]
MRTDDPNFILRLARDEADLEAAQRLRYRVFVEELGGSGALVDHARGLERDRFDPHFEHLILIDRRRDPSAGEHVVGVYRLMPPERVEKAGGYYSATEYDLGPLRRGGRRLLELGRSCVDRAYRTSPAMFHLWKGLGQYVVERDIDILFGVASFHGTDLDALAAPLSLLHHRHLAPPDLRVTAIGPDARRMDLLPPDRIDRVAAARQIPALIKAYLRLGGFVGERAFVDWAFNTVDVCLVMDTRRMSDEVKAQYTSHYQAVG